MPEWCEAEGNLTADTVNVRDELCRVLRDRGGGSLLRGWRNELDPDFLLSVSYKEVVRVAASFGLQMSEDLSFVDQELLFSWECALLIEM
ncbi:rab1D [Symbiodinium natans]|uniref:Rab1D protein n=1 Tax=Symbiodinium natans TaxID=878477 RepID=A0A812RKG7_9DINO|nr:rab1D [Symbiodinium natans]